MVGSYEYFRALQRFEMLLEISTSEQVEIYNKLLAQQPELTFYAGMYLQPDVKESLDLSVEADKAHFDELFLRSGLEWMMTLAKIELGATVSLYGDQKMSQPFEIFPPSPAEGEAFLTIIADDLQAHAVDLLADKRMKEIAENSREVDSWTLAYLRRISLMVDMISVLKTV